VSSEATTLQGKKAGLPTVASVTFAVGRNCARLNQGNNGSDKAEINVLLN